MTEIERYKAMGTDQARAFVTVTAAKVYKGPRWKTAAARDYGITPSAVQSWFRKDGRPPFWFLSICEARIEIGLLNGYLVRGLKD